MENNDCDESSWVLCHTSVLCLLILVKVGGTPLCAQVACLTSASSSSEKGAGLQSWWQPRPGLSLPRAHAGVVSAGVNLFVLGGRSQVQQVQQVLKSVEVYDGRYVKKSTLCIQ